MINRIAPALPFGAYKTYQLLAPVSTHYRRATCAEVDCQPYQHGWAVTVAAGSDDEATCHNSGRHFTAERQADGFLRFVFPPGQPCFRASVHVVPLEREPLYLVRRGTWAVDPAENLQVLRRHVSGEDWVDDFATHQQRIADQIERG